MNPVAWTAPDRAYAKKSSDWYWTVGIIAAALVVVCIIFGNALFAVVIGLGTFTLALLTAQKPKSVKVEISDKGIVIDKMLYPYPVLDAFGINESNQDHAHLMLKSKKVFIPLITVPAPKDKTDEIRDVLKNHLKEETFNRGIMETAFERLGF